MQVWWMKVAKPILPLKLVVMATSLERLQNKHWINQSPPYGYQSWKSGEDWSSTFWDIWQDIVTKDSFSSFVISGVTRQNLTKFIHSVQKSLPCNILKLRLQSSNPFRNTSATNEGGISQVYLIAPKLIQYHSNISWVTAKWMSD